MVYLEFLFLSFLKKLFVKDWLKKQDAELVEFSKVLSSMYSGFKAKWLYYTRYCCRVTRNDYITGIPYSQKNVG